MTRTEFEQNLALRIAPVLVRMEEGDPYSEVVDFKACASKVRGYVKAIAREVWQNDYDAENPNRMSNGVREGHTVGELRELGDLSSMTANCLMSNCVEYLSELEGVPERNISRIRHLGPKGIMEIEAALKKYGYGPMI